MHPGTVEIDIAGRVYSLVERTQGQHYTATLESDEGKVYTLHCHHGAWTCNCADQKYRKPSGGCKHIFACRRRLEDRAREQAGEIFTTPHPPEQTQAAALPPEQQPRAEARRQYQEQLTMPATTETPARDAPKPNELKILPTVPAPSLSKGAEQALIKGDLAELSETDRLSYYKAVCESIGLNPLTQPFGYIALNNKLQLYAKKNCTDQLRTLHNISVTRTSRTVEDGILTVEAEVCNGEGRQDMDIGCVVIAGLKGEALANAQMKAMTKAKRRATLSICGLGWLDESELDTLSPAATSGSDEPTPARLPAPSRPSAVSPMTQTTPSPISGEQGKRINELAQALGFTHTQLEAWTKKHWKSLPGDLTKQGADEAIGRLEAEIARRKTALEADPSPSPSKEAATTAEPA